MLASRTVAESFSICFQGWILFGGKKIGATLPYIDAVKSWIEGARPGRNSS